MQNFKFQNQADFNLNLFNFNFTLIFFLNHVRQIFFYSLIFIPLEFVVVQLFFLILISDSSFYF